MTQLSSIFFGGIVPALLFGIGSTLQRGSNISGITPSIYLGFLSLGFFVAAVFLSFTMPHQILSMKGCFLAGLNPHLHQKCGLRSRSLRDREFCE